MAEYRDTQDGMEPSVDDALAQLLRRDAAVDGPEFSPALHRRIMAAVAREGDRAHRRRIGYRILSAAAGIAAVILLGIMLGTPPTKPNTGQQVTPVVAVPPVTPMLTAMARQAGSFERHSVAPWTTLCSDVTRFGHFVYAQLDGYPLPQGQFRR